MSARSISVLCALVLVAVAGPAAAQIDCGNVATSAFEVPKELVDYCWMGPSPSAAPRFPGDLAFGPDMVNGNLVNFPLNGPEVLTVIAPFDTTNFTGACEFAVYDYSKLYCADNINGWFTVDTATGVRTAIGPLTPAPPNGETPSGLAFDNNAFEMYLCTTNVTTSSLLRVSPLGSTTLVGTVTNSPGLIACAVDQAGNLWGYDIVNDQFLSINTTTGAGTVVGSLGFNANFGQGMDFDDSDGTCYMFAFNSDTFQPELRICDTSTGGSTLVGVLGATVPGALAQISGAGIAAGGSFEPTMFAIDEVTDEFYGINPATGEVVLIGAAGEDFSFSGLAWNSWNKTMYVSDLTMATGWGLGRINIYTGEVTVIGDHTTTTDVHGLAFDSTNNVLYGSDISNSCLATIDKNTGVATCVGPLGAGAQIRGLGYNNDTDTLYGIDEINLFTVDRATGDATVVGPHGMAGSSLMGLEYDAATGVLYAGMAGDPVLYTLNPATGAASAIGPHGLNALGGLASFMAPGEPCGLFCDGFETGNTTMWAITTP